MHQIVVKPLGFHFNISLEMNIHTQQALDSASELLRQFAQTEEDPFSTILTIQNLEDFQKQSTKRSRKYPACKTLSIFMKQVASENKSCRSALISDAKDQIALGAHAIINLPCSM